jgi:hypothetical protein
MSAPYEQRGRYLESILLVHLFDWDSEPPELVSGSVGVVSDVRPMTRTVGMLGGVYEPENGSARRGGCHG